MSVVFEKTKLLTDKQFHYCPGCNHGIIHRLVAEVIDEMNLDGKVIGVAPVGCSVFAYDYFNCDMYEAAHGRAPAVATGAKRVVGQAPQGLHVKLAAQRSGGGPLHVAHLAEGQAEGLQIRLRRLLDDAGRDFAQARAHTRPDGLLGFGCDLLAHNGVDQGFKEIRHNFAAHRADQINGLAQTLVPRLEMGHFFFAVLKINAHPSPSCAVLPGLA